MLRKGGSDSVDEQSSSTDHVSGQILKLSQCGLAWSERFSFYDQIHTTGMDIKQHPRANAAITVGKDTTFRDFAQGAYRMRGLAKGQPQKLDIFIIPEVWSLVEKEVSSRYKETARITQADRKINKLSDKAAGAVSAWMLLNSIRLESKQMMQLCVQNVDSVYRRAALSEMLSASSSRKTAERQAFSRVFMEHIDVKVASKIPTPKSFVDELKLRSQINDIVVGSLLKGEGKTIVTKMIDMGSAQLGGKSDCESAEEWSRRSIDASQTKTAEQETQVEQEKQKQREVERESSTWQATARDYKQPVTWKLSDIGVGGRGGGGKWPKQFYPISDFVLNGEPKKCKGKIVQLSKLTLDKAHVVFSENFAAKRFLSPFARRLRSVNTCFQYGNKGMAAVTLLEAATIRRAVMESGVSNDDDNKFKIILREDGQCLVGGSEGDDHVATLKCARSAELQLLRYFDNRFDFNNLQASALLSLLCLEKPVIRQHVFVAISMCRRRDGNEWKGTELAPLMQVEQLDDFTDIVKLKKSILSALISTEVGMSPLELAKAIDVNNDQEVDVDEVIAYLSSDEMQRIKDIPKPKHLKHLKVPLALIADKSMDGRISYEEFIDFLQSE